MTALFLDPVFGVSGNMMLGLLLDLGVDPERIWDPLRKALPGEFTVHTTTVMRGALRARHVEVIPTGTLPPHAHTHAAAIADWITASGLSPRVKQQSQQIFDRLAAAEGRVHGIEPNEVTFHEVGAVDSLVDIVGTCLGLEALGVERIFCGPVALGSGFTTSQHGLIPLPAPATTELLQGVPLSAFACDGELTTPTGAAIIRALATFGEHWPVHTIDTAGYGAGTRSFPTHPNVLRGFLGTEQGMGDTGAMGAERVSVLSANLDDMTPELLAEAADQLREAGALDVWMTPVLMKKGRPGMVLQALSREGEEAVLRAVFFAHTSTLGVRVAGPFWRYALARDSREVLTPYGAVTVKIGWQDGEPVNVAPEFESVKRVAHARGVPVKVVYAAALAAEEEGRT